MTTVEMTLHLAASAQTVWKRIGGFATLHEWHPTIEQTEMDGAGVGARRTLFLDGGGKVIERLEDEDPVGRSYTYTIVESPLPVANYLATIRVEPEGADGCTVHWSSTFEPDGVPEDEAKVVIRGIYEAGFGSLVNAFGT